jgi:Lrp/AsnC family leucine-responsive transcriptional regulator
MKLDDKDRRLLIILSTDGRLTNRELAKRVDLAPSSCHARVRKLESAGFIHGYRAIVSFESIKGGLSGWADIKLVEPSPPALDSFLGLLKQNPAIVEAHQVAGHYDYILRFVSQDAGVWTGFRRSLEQIGCAVQARFSVLIEPLK